MKKSIYYSFLLILLLLNNFNLFTQWVQQTSGTSTHLTEVRFINQNTGWVCGFWSGTNTATIYKSTNGGLNWILENTGNIPSSFTSEYFYSDSIGWAAGQFGKIVHTSNGGQPASITKIENEMPNQYLLHQNYPNPFNSQTNIEFDITSSDIYILSVYNVIGKKVEEMFNKYLIAGKYKVNYSADNLSSGTYFYRLSSSKFYQTNKFILLK